MPPARAQPGIAGDRCARAIVGILTACSGALAATECQPVRRPGSVVDILFLMLARCISLPEGPLCQLRRASARCAGVVRRPVVRMARCADVVRRPVVLIARCGQPDRMLRVVQIKARDAGRDPRCACYQPNARRAACGPRMVWSAQAVGNPTNRDRSAEHGIAVDRPCRCAQDRWFFTDQPERSIDVVLAGAAAKLHRSASGARGWQSVLDGNAAVSILQRPLCQLPRASARGAGVVRRPVLLRARGAGCGTEARCAECPFWAA